MKIILWKLLYFLKLMLLLFWSFLSLPLQIANYIPSDEDLNYPAKLEQSAEAESETTSVQCLRLVTLFSYFFNEHVWWILFCLTDICWLAYVCLLCCFNALCIYLIESSLVSGLILLSCMLCHIYLVISIAVLVWLCIWVLINGPIPKL